MEGWRNWIDAYPEYIQMVELYYKGIPPAGSSPAPSTKLNTKNGKKNVKTMPREPLPLKREHNGDISINIADIFRNPEIQKEVIRRFKKLKPRKRK